MAPCAVTYSNLGLISDAVTSVSKRESLKPCSMVLSSLLTRFYLSRHWCNCILWGCRIIIVLLEENKLIHFCNAQCCFSGICSGQQQSFDGNIYNLRLWNYAMSIQELVALKCDHVGNVIDWDNSYWTIPASLAQTNTSLSCSEYRKEIKMWLNKHDGGNRRVCCMGCDRATCVAGQGCHTDLPGGLNWVTGWKCAKRRELFYSTFLLHEHRSESLFLCTSSC